MKIEQNFWAKLKKPIMAMAPMANVTDAAFRRMFVEYGKPNVFWTEFVSVEGLLSRGKEHLLTDLWFTEAEHPIVAQIFGGKPEQFEPVAAMIKKLGFDGIDINMGCPDRGVERSGGGAALMKDPERAKQIIRAAKRGAGGLPISVKTRIGYAKNQIAEWIPALLEEDLAALTVHLRTRHEMSNVPAHWELAREINELRRSLAPETILLGNGDVATLADAREKCKTTGLDGIMFGRAMFGNPWFFSGKMPTLKERLETMVKHTELFEKLYLSDRPRTHLGSGPARFADNSRARGAISREGMCRPPDEGIASSQPIVGREAETLAPHAFPPSEPTMKTSFSPMGAKPADSSTLATFEMGSESGKTKNFDVMKKHFKAYAAGFDGAKELRALLMETENAAEVREITEEFLSSIKA